MKNKKTIVLAVFVLVYTLVTHLLVIPYAQKEMNRHLLGKGWNFFSIVWAILTVMLSIHCIVKWNSSDSIQKCLRIALPIITAYFCYVLKNLYCTGCAACG